MIGGMTGFHRDEKPAAGGGGLTISEKLRFDPGSVRLQLGDFGLESKGYISGRGSQEFNGVFGGNGAWRMIFASILH